MQDIFSALDGEMGDLRDECLEKNSMKVTDLKDYENPMETPERDLCFYKCFYEGIGFIDANGQLDMEDLKEIPIFKDEVEGLEDKTVKELEECLGKIGKIHCCGDLRKIDQCFVNATM